MVSFDITVFANVHPEPISSSNLCVLHQAACYLLVAHASHTDCYTCICSVLKRDRIGSGGLDAFSRPDESNSALFLLDLFCSDRL